MLTKHQKKEKISESQELLEKSRTLVFVDFEKTGVSDMEKLRRSLKDLGAKIKVIKKKLMRIALNDKKIDFNPEQFEAQVGTIFSPMDVSEIAVPVYKSKIKILGAYDLETKSFIDAERVKFIGQLPSREVILGQLVGMISAPIKMFMHVLNEKGRK